MSDEAAGSAQRIETYGPKWSPGPFERGRDGPHLVLAGVDGSPTAMRAGAYAAGLARRQRSRLVVVFVLAPSAWTGMSPGLLAGAQEETYEAMISELREPIKRMADETGLPITFVVQRGDAYTELKRAAIAHQADLVVVGASESAGHRLVGSVATRLVKAGLWPVTVVP
ncbi:MAG TPA: universal stress protein [Amycolatopsis sp.]|nr:universal stress protein [Amycolatopsis sp.]HVV08482.1 universal stress protein [Amycolatopsis sp.]